MIFCKCLSIMNGKQLITLHIWVFKIIISWQAPMQAGCLKHGKHLCHLCTHGISHHVPQHVSIVPSTHHGHVRAWKHFIVMLTVFMTQALIVYSRMLLEMPKRNPVNISVLQVDFDCAPFLGEKAHEVKAVAGLQIEVSQLWRPNLKIG